MNLETGTDAATAQTFLSALYEGAESGYLCLFTVPGDQPRWFSVLEARTIAQEAIRLAEERDTYFGIGLHRRPPAAGRGLAADVCAIPGLWVEADIAHACHSAADLPQTLGDVQSLLARFPYPPSWIVHSGHGIHAWWLFREPWFFENRAEHDAAAMLARRFQRWFQEQARERGWRIDSTGDLARVLRLPGTWNRKVAAEVLPVQSIHEDNSRRYNPSDFDELLPNVEDYAVRWAPKAGGTFPPAPLAPILAGCGWMRHCREDARTLTEPEWYAALGILGRCENGGDLGHQWSKPYSGYDREETERKLVQAVAASGPRTCAGIRYDLHGEQFCSVCPNWARIRSPILLATPTGDLAPLPSDDDAPPERGEDTAERVHAADRRANEAKQKLEHPGRNGTNGKHPTKKPFSFDNGLTAAKMQGMRYPSLVWPVPGLICEGLTLTSGREKMGKSRLFEEMAVAIAQGGRVFGVDEFRALRGEVLLLALEEEERLIQERLHQWLGSAPWPENLTIFTEWPNQEESPSAVDTLEQWMARRPETSFILLDTFRRVRGPVRRGENAYDADSRAIQPFHDFTQRHRGVALTVVHHSNKLNAEDDHDTISGSTGLPAVPDRVMVLRRKRGEPVATLSFSGRRGPWRKIRLRDDHVTGTWVYEGEADETPPQAVSPDRYAITEALTGRWLSATELAHELGRTEDREYNSLRKLLTKMKESGTLVNSGGKWSVYGTEREVV